MKFSLNQKQREILYCFFNNGVCFVNASAGTGKTSTITELYLELLRKKEKVSNIVVITFTKAAANEMLIRIRLKIRNEIKEAKSENDKKYWQNIYRDILTSAKISTINSFAHSIVLEHSMGLSMPPNIAILEDSSEFNNRLKDEILNVLKDVSYTEKIRKLYRIYTEESKNQFADKILKGHAAICGKLAAQIYGLEVLAEGIETNKRNFTRFLVIADQWVADELMRDEYKNKSSLVFALPHTAGSLSKVLSVLSFYDMNLTKIQSLPIIGREWEYLFYINLTFNNYTRYKQALDAIRPLTKDLKILGEYAEGKQSI